MILSPYDRWLTTNPKDDKDEVVAQDAYKNDIYSDTLVYDTEIGIVKAEYMTKFFEDRNELSGHSGTFKFFDGSYENIENIEDVILYDGYFFTLGEVHEFLEFYGWYPILYNEL